MLAGVAGAAEVTVDSPKALASAVGKARPGDTLVLKDGRYPHGFNASGKGKEGAPIVIRSETPGGAEIQGPVTIKGQYLSLVGFRFTGKGAIQVSGSRGCRVSRCHMNNVQAGKWLTVDDKSRNIEIDHCLFEKKENNRKMPKGCQLIQIRQSNTGEAHHIHHNHFRDIPKGSTGNGFETLQLITSGNPKDPGGKDAKNLVEYNLFERCDGEAEIISVKANGCVLRANTFRACRGSLVLRHGHRNVVNGNWFIGDGKAGSGGVRLQGRDQVVVNNHCYGLTSSGLAMMDGTEDKLYVRVERALVAHNTFVDCQQAFLIGINHSKYPNGTVPRECTIANNVFQNDKDSAAAITFVKNEEPEVWTWQNNLVRGALGITPRQGIEAGNPHLRITADGTALPTSRTPVAPRPKGERKELDADIFNAVRPEKGTLGAVQFSAGTPAGRPLESTDVGPSAK